MILFLNKNHFIAFFLTFTIICLQRNFTLSYRRTFLLFSHFNFILIVLVPNKISNFSLFTFWFLLPLYHTNFIFGYSNKILNGSNLVTHLLSLNIFRFFATFLYTWMSYRIRYFFFFRDWSCPKIYFWQSLLVQIRWICKSFASLTLVSIIFVSCRVLFEWALIIWVAKF